MLVLKRHALEWVPVNGNTWVAWTRATNGDIQLVFDAPDNVSIVRAELVQYKHPPVVVR